MRTNIKWLLSGFDNNKCSNYFTYHFTANIFSELKCITKISYSQFVELCSLTIVCKYFFAINPIMLYIMFRYCTTTYYYYKNQLLLCKWIFRCCCIILFCWFYRFWQRIDSLTKINCTTLHNVFDKCQSTVNQAIGQ